MPTSVSEFEEDTAFERYLLDRAMPLLPRVDGSSVIELGDVGSTSVAVTPQPIVVRVGLTDSLGSAGGQVDIGDVRALFFGAAWKVFDLLAELSLEQARVPHNAGSRYTISFKAKRARQGTVPPVSPFGQHPTIWSRILRAYASTEDLRNSLAHRRVIVDQATGDIRGVPKPGSPAPQPLTVDEQSAFCRAAVGAAQAVVSAELPTRRADQLRWAADQLTSHHGEQPFGTSSAQGVVPTVIVRASPGPTGELALDFADIHQRARAAVGGVSHYDLEIHLADTQLLSGPLEDIPKSMIIFSVDSPPAGLRLT